MKHKLNELTQQEQENYLNLREQYGLVVATKYKNSTRVSDLIPLFYALAIANTAVSIMGSSLKHNLPSPKRKNKGLQK